MITAFLALFFSGEYKSIPIYCNFYKDIKVLSLPREIDGQEFLERFSKGPLSLGVVELFEPKNVLIRIIDSQDPNRKTTIFI
jgi:hypothetical protein